MAIREQTETRFYTSDGRAFTDRHEALEAELVEQLAKVLCTEVKASRHGHYNSALAGMKVFDANELARRIALRARDIVSLLDEHLRSSTPQAAECGLYAPGTK